MPASSKNVLARQTLLLLPDGQPRTDADGYFVEDAKTIRYPYDELQDLDSLLSPPFAVINGGPKLAHLNLDAIASKYGDSDDSRTAVKSRLQLLCELWQVIWGSKEDALSWWGDLKGLTKGEAFQRDLERLSGLSGRTTRSQSQRSAEQSGSRKRKAESHSSGPKLTKRAVFQLNKQQKTKTGDMHQDIQHWAQSIHTHRFIT